MWGLASSVARSLRASERNSEDHGFDPHLGPTQFLLNLSLILPAIAEVKLTSVVSGHLLIFRGVLLVHHPIILTRRS